MTGLTYHQYAALGRIDPTRMQEVVADLELVDQLERRLGEMTWPAPPGPPVSAAQPLAQLFSAARSTVLHWHEFASRSGSEPPPHTTRGDSAEVGAP